jgi:choline dehydrogenase-like flavoprotein
MDLGIAGRKAIVCASSRGLGRACAFRLAEAGCEVVVNGRDKAKTESTAAEIAKATGAKEVWSARGNMPTIHLMGGTIMGANAGDSVTNSYGQTHEIPNLWMAGPCIFPTEGASNPTYTIFAVSQRGAENLAANWKTIANKS